VKWVVLAATGVVHAVHAIHAAVNGWEEVCCCGYGSVHIDAHAAVAGDA